MPSRTSTKDLMVIHLPSPDGRNVDFSETPSAPHAVRITVPKDTSYRTTGLYWNEEHATNLSCIQGRVHAFSGTGIYNNVDSFWGAGSSKFYPAFTAHSWQRNDCWGTKASEPRVSIPPKARSPSDIMAARRDRDLEKGNPTSPAPQRNTDDQDLIVDVTPDPDYWSQRYGKQYELLYRNFTSMTLDAPVYPSLSSTPFPIRLLFKSSSFLFSRVLRDKLIAWFLSVQLLVLYSSFDYHPNLGSLPITTLYALLKFPKYWLPGAPQFPGWIARWQWNSMVVVSHVKVAFWSRIGRWFLGMSVVYDEYTPERLKGSLEQRL